MEAREGEAGFVLGWLMGWWTSVKLRMVKREKSGFGFEIGVWVHRGSVGDEAGFTKDRLNSDHGYDEDHTIFCSTSSSREQVLYG